VSRSIYTLIFLLLAFILYILGPKIEQTVTHNNVEVFLPACIGGEPAGVVREVAEPLHGGRARRFNVFKENVQYIHQANKKDHPYRLALNKFADMTTDEFWRTYAGSRVRHHWAL
jgi:hypothetical protein